MIEKVGQFFFGDSKRSDAFEDWLFGSNLRSNSYKDLCSNFQQSAFLGGAVSLLFKASVKMGGLLLIFKITILMICLAGFGILVILNCWQLYVILDRTPVEAFKNKKTRWLVAVIALLIYVTGMYAGYVFFVS